MVNYDCITSIMNEIPNQHIAYMFKELLMDVLWPKNSDFKDLMEAVTKIFKVSQMV